MKIKDAAKDLGTAAVMLMKDDQIGAALWLDNRAKAIEQHHKDLMGLVEAWNGYTNTYGDRLGTFDEGVERGKSECADQLKSIINPKD